MTGSCTVETLRRHTRRVSSLLRRSSVSSCPPKFQRIAVPSSDPVNTWEEVPVPRVSPTSSSSETQACCWSASRTTLPYKVPDTSGQNVWEGLWASGGQDADKGTKTCTVSLERFETVARAQVPKPREVLKVSKNQSSGLGSRGQQQAEQRDTLVSGPNKPSERERARERERESELEPLARLAAPSAHAAASHGPGLRRTSTTPRSESARPVR